MIVSENTFLAFVSLICISLDFSILKASEFRANELLNTLNLAFLKKHYFLWFRFKYTYH